MDYFLKNWFPILIIVLFFSVLLYFLLDLVFVFMAICLLVVVIIGLFDPKRIKNSLKFIIVFIFLSGLVSSPIFFGLFHEYYRLNNPETILKMDDPWIDELANEFKNVPNFSNNQLNKIGAFVEAKVPYKENLFQIFYPSIDDVKRQGGGDCRGRALVAFGILKKLGYKRAYLAASLPDHHVWIRVYENGAYKEIFNYYKSDAYLLFNEQKSLWGDRIDELKKLLFFGFRADRFSWNFMLSLLFFIPTGFWLILSFISNKKRNFRKSIVFLIGIFLMALSASFFSVLVFGRITSIFISVISGLTLRSFSILNLKNI